MLPKNWHFQKIVFELRVYFIWLESDKDWAMPVIGCPSKNKSVKFAVCTKTKKFKK